MTTRNNFLDEGPDGWVAGKSDVTRSDYADIDPEELVKLPGGSGEHKRFAEHPTGFYSQHEWRAFVKDIKRNGVCHFLLVFVEQDGRILLAEGNHRVRAAIQAGVTTVPVEIRYFGNSQRNGLAVVDDRLVLDNLIVS